VRVREVEAVHEDLVNEAASPHGIAGRRGVLAIDEEAQEHHKSEVDVAEAIELHALAVREELRPMSPGLRVGAHKGRD